MRGRSAWTSVAASLVLASLLSATGCAGATGSDAADGTPVSAETAAARAGEVVEIKEKMFIAQTNEIYLNAEDYLGKTIRYEGFFDRYEDEITGATYCYVLRNGPGCCPGVDNTAGFEVAWYGAESYPEPNEWVEATGVLEEYEEDGGWSYLRIKLSALNVLDERGAEFVTQ